MRKQRRWVQVNVTRFPGSSHYQARRIMTRAPDHVLRNGRNAGHAYLVASVEAVHTHACPAVRWRKDGYGRCACGAKRLMKNWVEEGQ